jgi:nitrate reductase gamma subunit
MKTRTFLKSLEILVFLYAAICLFYFVYVAAADFQDFSHLGKMMPVYLGLVTPTYLLFILHLVLYPVSYQRLRLTLFVNGVVLAVISILNIFLIIKNVTGSVYSSFLQGGITSLFPLDFFILSFLYAGLGICLAVYGYRLADSPRPYVGAASSLGEKIAASIGRPLYVLFSLYVTGAFLFGFTMANYGSPTFMLMMPTYALMLLSPTGLLYYEWFYRESEETNKNDKKKRLWSSGIYFGVGLLAALLYFVFIFISPNYMVDNAQPYFALEFMGSIKGAPVVLMAAPLIAGLICFIRALKIKKAQ